jgi:hypothetical protein
LSGVSRGRFGCLLLPALYQTAALHQRRAAIFCREEEVKAWEKAFQSGILKFVKDGLALYFEGLG